MELTPEEKRRIYEEEKARVEAQEKVKKEKELEAKKAQEKQVKKVGIGCAVIILIIIIIIGIGGITGSLTPDNKTYGDVPTGDLSIITPDSAYSGDLMVGVYLTNTGSLIKAYQHLNMKVYMSGSAQAEETPNFPKGTRTTP